jgi:hypothetical protein
LLADLVLFEFGKQPVDVVKPSLMDMSRQPPDMIR